MDIKDTANIGLSSAMHANLSEMQDNGIFTSMLDGYRLAVSIAIKHQLQVEDTSLPDRKNMYDVGGVDENFIFRNAIALIYPTQKGREYKYLEKLADVGVKFLYKNYDQNGSLDIRELLGNDP